MELEFLNKSLNFGTRISQKSILLYSLSILNRKQGIWQYIVIFMYLPDDILMTDEFTNNLDANGRKMMRHK